MQVLRPKYHVPPKGLIEVFAPEIFTWVVGGRATLVKFAKGSDGDLRFYRHRFEDGEKSPIVFSSEGDVRREIADQQAFAFIADSSVESPGGIMSVSVAPVDLDPRPHTSYSTIRQRILDFARFLADEVNLDILLTHSGAKSFHVRIPVADPALGEWGYVLPRVASWDTLLRRRKDELPVLYVSEALELLTQAYSAWSKLGPVSGRDARRNKRAREVFFFDNRCGVRVGIRVPGSFHPSTGGICRNFDAESVPPTLAALRDAVSPVTVLRALADGHPEVLAAPDIPPATRAHNTSRLLAFTREWVEATYADVLAGNQPQGGIAK
jgi:hypothetical protein